MQTVGRQGANNFDVLAATINAEISTHLYAPFIRQVAKHLVQRAFARWRSLVAALLV